MSQDMLLVLDATEGRVRFVVADTHEQRMLCAQDWEAPSHGTELLPPALDAALRRLNIRPADMSRIACVHGPGSFTGIRLVLSFAAAMRRATGAQLAPISAMAALAAEVWSHALYGVVERVRVLTHARRGLVHMQDFAPPAITDRSLWGAVPVALSIVEQIPVEHALLHLNATSAQRVVLVGSGVTRNLTALQGQIDAAQVCPEKTVLCTLCHTPSARALLAVAAALPDDAWQTSDIEPLYVRPCDAVENLPHIAKKRGQAPEEALAQLDELLAQAPAPEQF